MLFLQGLAPLESDLAGGMNPFMMIGGAVFGVLAVAFLVALAVYVYFSLAYAAVGRKAGLQNPGIAWMPFGFGPLATIFEVSRSHWWPFPFFAIGYVVSYAVMMFGIFGGGVLTTIGLVSLIIVLVVFSIIAIIWHWKTYVAVGRPGWWILPPVIISALGYVLIFLSAFSPMLSLAGLVLFALSVLVHAVLVGIAGWGSGGKTEYQTERRAAMVAGRV
jgi:hypothetical protein